VKNCWKCFYRGIYLLGKLLQVKYDIVENSESFLPLKWQVIVIYNNHC